MEKDLEKVEFTLTPEMSLELIKFNEAKKKISKLKERYNLDKSDDILVQIEDLNIVLTQCKNNFIREFRSNNQGAIFKYLEQKDQK